MTEEAKPLLATSYDATALPPHASLKPTGRGKLRFMVRQQMKKNAERRRQVGVFHSLFPSHKSTSKARARSPKSSPVGGASPNKRTATSLSVDEGEEQASTKHSKLYVALNPKSSSTSARLYQQVITLVILFDALIYILSTDPNLARLSYLFYTTEAVTSTIFAIEYFARLMVCTEKKAYAKYGPIKGRWQYVCSSQALFDACATFPFFIELLTKIPLPTLTYLRVFRLLRLTRTRSYSQAMDAVGRVLYFNREILYVAALLGIYLVVVTSILMYYCRPRGDDIELIDDPTDFESIGKTMVLSTLMLTGQGGPSGKLPWYTQLVVLLTGAFSVAMFAIPASMLTWGFEAEAERLGAKAKKRALAKRRGEVYVSETSSSSSNASEISGFGDISTSDEEYLNIIGGDDDDDAGDDEKVVSVGKSSEFQSLVSRIEKLEKNAAQTNIKLDLILQKLATR